jgi:translocation and assembly module TamB
MIIGLNRSVVQIQQFRIEGPGTSISASGTANLKNENGPLAVNLNANADLGVLQDVDRDFYSSGSVALNATVHGSFANPLVNGRIELKNANVNYTQAPNGLSNANGVILLNGTSASIQTLTAESGGGRISLGGFVGYQNSALDFNLHATATRVRVRYSGISVTSNANITLTGSTEQSLVGGTVTIQRIAYGSSGDVGSILTSASAPATTPTAPSPLLSGMRLDIRVTTAPDLRVVTTYADRLSIFANLDVRGTAASPGMLGRVVVTDGQLVFFGNTYTVNTGTINFYNPNAIAPVVNISLNTIAQNVAVTLGVSGPINDLKLNYSSDPPLTFQQIVQLLATNTTPNDPTIASQQPAPPQQSFTQMGESAILGQAVANPLASRVQRVFGITQFKIDPSFQGSGGQPDARVTLQQKIASNITFTYITDVSQTNSEIVRVEWAFTPAFSAVALRDFNGNVSLEFFYRFKKR